MNLTNLKDKTILVIGGDSMIGTEVIQAYNDYNGHYENIFGTSHDKVDLLCPTQTKMLFKWAEPDYVVHLATYSGNGQFNQKYPFDTYWRTTQMALNVFEAARLCKVKKILSVLSSCSVADKGDVELTENDLHNGMPNQSIESHGFAKRNLHAISRCIFKQHGIPAVCCIVNNSFGPRDSFQPEKTKVVGALIKKFVDAKINGANSVINWGTGIAKRELIYSKDAAKLILMALANYNDSLTPINIGHPQEFSIRELSEMIKEIVGFDGHIVWDHSFSDGQLRKKLDLTRMNSELLSSTPFEYTDMKTAMKETIDWYSENRLTWKK